MLEKALEYLKSGLSVIPQARDKKSLISWKEYQNRLPTEQEVRDWWTKWPDANIAVVTGKISGITVIDIDTKKDENGNIIQRGDSSDLNTLTQVVESGGGGMHLYYKYNPTAKTGHIKELVEIKNDGGLITVPPSIHKSGNEYKVIRGGALAELVIGYAPKVSSFEGFDGVMAGSRNETATKVIGKILSTLPQEDWKTIGLEFARFWNSRNSPPLPDNELNLTFNSIAKREFVKRNTSVGGTIERLQTEVKTEEEKQRLLEIAKIYDGEDKMILSSELVELIKTRPEELKIMSGIKGLDDILKGFRPSQVVVVAAPTKNGKTSFCMELTTQMKEYCPAWFPLEEGAEELLTKFIERKEEPPIFCTPASYTKIDLNWIENKIIEAIVKYGTKIVFIDHLHFIVPFSAERTDLRIGETMRALKGIAKRWGITIFIIAHLKKTKLESQPELDDLRDSSFIAQEADTVMFLWRQGEKSKDGVQITNNVNLSVQANRRTGGTGNIKLVYDNGRFKEQEWEVKEDEKKKEMKKLIRRAKKEVEEEDMQELFDNL